MNIRKTILYSVGALAVALAPSVGFALPAAAGAEVSPAAFSVSVASPGVLPTQTPPPNPDDAQETSDEPADSADLPLTEFGDIIKFPYGCLLYTSPSPRDRYSNLVCRLLLEKKNKK